MDAVNVPAYFRNAIARSGPLLAGSPRNDTRYEAATQDPALAAADRRVAEIIRANGRVDTRSAVQAAVRSPVA